MSDESGNGSALHTGTPSEEDLRKIYGDAWDDTHNPEFRIRDWGMDRYVGAAKPIDWLIEDVLPRGIPGLMASMGGIGKSYLLLDLCVRVAAGPGNFGQFALGGSIKSEGRACMITAEESFSAVHRRLDQILNPGTKQIPLGTAPRLPLSVFGKGTILCTCSGG